MGKLKNTFSWSFSAAEDFDQCRRRHYWKKYGSWGGWDSSASEETKKAYLLKGMSNRWGLMGQAAELSVMWMLKEHQIKNLVTSEQAWDQIARPFLSKKWNESKKELWRKNAKQYCCLREHYYPNKLNENDIKRKIAAQIKNCIGYFEQTVLKRLSHIKSSQEFEIASADKIGDMEHFIYEGVKIYAIPDYAYRIDNQVHIHDWKAGKIKAEQHRLQLSLYALWAIVKYEVKLEDIFLYVEYLNEGQVLPFQLSQDDLDRTKEKLSDSVGEMTEYLADFDRDQNQPLPKEEWELTLDRSNCHFCNFYELCASEL